MKINNWTNTDNKQLYEKMPLEFFRSVAAQGGLDNGCDIKAISNYIHAANSILEIGAGYGRVLDSLLHDLNYKNELYGIERNKKLYNFLKSKFKEIKIICADIKEFSPDSKFDLILCMWGGISEFTQDEQPKILAKLLSMLNKNGNLIFDTILPECKTIRANKADGNNYVIQTEYGNDFIYLPSMQEIQHYIKTLNSQLVEEIIYTTATGKERYLYVIKSDY